MRAHATQNDRVGGVVKKFALEFFRAFSPSVVVVKQTEMDNLDARSQELFAQCRTIAAKLKK